MSGISCISLASTPPLHANANSRVGLKDRPVEIEPAARQLADRAVRHCCRKAVAMFDGHGLAVATPGRKASPGSHGARDRTDAYLMSSMSASRAISARSSAGLISVGIHPYRRPGIERRRCQIDRFLGRIFSRESRVFAGVRRPFRLRRFREEQQPEKAKLRDCGFDPLGRIKYAGREPCAPKSRTPWISRAISERRRQQKIEVTAFRRNAAAWSLRSRVRAHAVRRSCPSVWSLKSDFALRPRASSDRTPVSD